MLVLKRSYSLSSVCDINFAIKLENYEPSLLIFLKNKKGLEVFLSLQAIEKLLTCKSIIREFFNNLKDYSNSFQDINLDEFSKLCFRPDLGGLSITNIDRYITILEPTVWNFFELEPCMTCAVRDLTNVISEIPDLICKITRKVPADRNDRLYHELLFIVKAQAQKAQRNNNQGPQKVCQFPGPSRPQNTFAYV